MKNCKLTKKESTLIAEHMKGGVQARKQMVAYFAANPQIAEFIIHPSETSKDLTRFGWLSKGNLSTFKELFPDSFDEDTPVFGRADGKKRIKTDLGVAMLNLVNWAKSALPKPAREEKQKTIDDLAVALINAIKMAEKNGIPMDQVKAQFEALAKTIK